MSVLDLFSAGPGIRTNKLAANALTSGQQKGFDYGRTNLNRGATQGIGTLEDYLGQAQGSLTGGTQQQVGAYQAGIDPWKQLFAQYQPGADTYWGALGIGDEDAVDAARGKFQASPGYDYTLGQGLEGVSRVGQSTGQLGAANMDAMKFAHNLSDQDFQQWVSNLLPAISGQQNAAQGIQQGQNLIGGAYGDQGKNLAELFGRTGSSVADIQGGLGKDLASLGEQFYGNKGQIQANRLQGNQAARTAADSNSLSALFGIAGLGTSLLGGGGLGNLFSGGGSSNADNGYFYDQGPNDPYPNWSY